MRQLARRQWSTSGLPFLCLVQGTSAAKHPPGYHLPTTACIAASRFHQSHDISKRGGKAYGAEDPRYTGWQQ
ncbi:MAG: hypothetical protein AB7D92_04285 [Sphaerochaeta sp.]